MATTRKRKIYYPYKYYAGLSKRAKTQRAKEIAKFGALDWKDPKAYTGFKTDVGRKTRKSSYTSKLAALIGPGPKSLKEKADATGVPVKFLKECYDRGMAAWRTGHRPGATEQQWGWARVASLLTCGKTHYGPDSDLVRKARRTSRSARTWFKRCPEKK